MRYASVLAVVMIACGSTYGEDAKLNAETDAGSPAATPPEGGPDDAGAGDTGVVVTKEEAGALPDEPLCSGTCGCPANGTCKFVCPADTNCQLLCSAGSNCEIYCGGANCIISCNPTATCKCIERGGHCV